jgi:hypothetical protein
MRQRNEYALKAFQKHFQEETRLIHFGPVAPILENVLYALALFRKKEQKTMLEGKDLLLRMIAYQSERGFFPDAIHLFSHPHYSWKKNILIASTILLTLQEFDRVIDKVSKEKIKSSLGRLLAALESIELDPILSFLLRQLTHHKGPCDLDVAKVEDLTLLVVAMNFIQDDTALKTVKSLIEDNVGEGLPFYQGPFEGIKQMQGHPAKSILEIALTQEEDLKEEIGIDDRVWMESVLAKDCSSFKGKADLVRHKNASEKTDLYTRAFLDLEKGCTATLYAGQNVVFDPKRGVYTITLEGQHDEDQHEIALYLSLDPSISVDLNGAKSSIFRPLEIVSIRTPEKKIDLAFLVSEGEGKFIGHISLDSKPFELEKGGMYDRKISIRTVERDLRCQIELFIGWNQEKCPF